MTNVTHTTHTAHAKTNCYNHNMTEGTLRVLPSDVWQGISADLSFNLTLDDNMVAEYGVDCEVTVVRWRIALDEK